MKITVYAHPQTDPNSVARQVKAIVESQTGLPCIVKFTGDYTRQGRLTAGEE